jgi:hypothetical protein
MALNAHVICLDGIKPGRIDDVRARRTRDVRAARAMAFLAPDIPFGHRLGTDVVIHRMAAVAQRTCRTLEIVRRIEGCPPVRARLDDVWRPDLVRDVPLHGKRKIVVADFLEIALFPFASVDEGDIVRRKWKDRIGFGKVRNDGVGVFPRVAHHVGHAGLAPSLVEAGVTRLACRGAGVLRFEQEES